MSHPLHPGRPLRGAVVAVLLLLLGGCATTLTPPERQAVARHERPVELTQVPFYPDETNQCGPAALATVLDWAGQAVTPQQLRRDLFIPARGGTLQIEMTAQARRHGRLAYPLAPNIDALLGELEAGHPVVVLQNLGLSWIPFWHYAVVVGFRPTAKTLVLRSGREREHVIALPVFERTWARSDHWALLVLPPGQLPATATAADYFQATHALEQTAGVLTALPAWQAGARHWPRDLALMMGLGNAHYALGDMGAAERSFRAATGAHPGAGIAWNNLALVLAREGRQREALGAAQRAVNLGGPFRNAFTATLEQIRRGPTDAP